MLSFTVNKQRVNLDVDPATPLLWVLREDLGLTGTKYGCGMAHSAGPVPYTSMARRCGPA